MSASDKKNGKTGSVLALHPSPGHLLSPSGGVGSGGALFSGEEGLESSIQLVTSPLRQGLILPGIIHPSQIGDLSVQQLEQLAAEIRATLVETVSRTGGHLAPSLGVVELTLALLSVFNPARDKLVWDVGHQAYAYKLLTGRKERFHTLRQLGGISGFPNRQESPFDHFGVGHSSTSVSAALGMAVARDLAGEDHHVVSVIGDGSLTAGMAYEGMNQAGAIAKRFIVVLNDNEMSISKNVGALSLFMSRNLSARWVRKVKREVECLLSGIPGIGEDLVEIARRSKHSFKNFFTPGMLFEALRFNYIGAVDGHNIEELQKAFHLASTLERPVLLHVLTRKGKGYGPAERNPVHYHGVGSFNPETGAPAVHQGQRTPIMPETGGLTGGGTVQVEPDIDTPPCSIQASRVRVEVSDRAQAASVPTYTQAFSDAICKLAEADERIVAITAAMPEGTGLQAFSERFPDRFFDVGICEQHAVTFAAGLATQGLRPFVCVYSTFLQRAYDQIVHDVCIQSLPVTLCLDRAGLVGEDGATHHGAFDISFLRHIPNMTFLAPKDEAELQLGLVTALAMNRPFALRYPRGRGTGAALPENILQALPLPAAKMECLQRGDGSVALVAVGNMAAPAVEAARLFQANGGGAASVYSARWIKPLPVEDLKEIAITHDKLLIVEENALAGGFSSSVLEYFADVGLLSAIQVFRMGLPDAFVEHGPADLLRARTGLDTKGIQEKLAQILS